MKIIQETTWFVHDVQIDINYLLIQKYQRPLVIATRESQIYRILTWQDEHNIVFPVIGWWDLIHKEYLCENGLIRSRWVEHDVVIFLDDSRAADKEVYETLKQIVSNIV